jgi:hypothetical protein
MSVSGVNSSISSLISNSNSSQSQALKTLLTSLESRPTLFDFLAEGSSSSSSDILDLSSEAQSAADQLYELLQSTSLNSIQTSVDQASASIREKLQTALAEAGIDTSSEIDLQVDSSGNVVVTNDNSQSRQIEDAINNDADLKKAVVEYLQFMQTVAPSLTSDSNSATETSSALSQLLSALGVTSQGTVTLAIQGNDFETVYQDSYSNAVVLASSQF